MGELLLRLRANYLWPTLWGSMVYVDDPLNQPLLDAYEVVLGGSHTEPLMRAQNEFKSFYQGQWAYNLNNQTIDEYFKYGVERAKPYARNSLWTMAMRGTGDTAIEGDLGVEGIITMLEKLVANQRKIIADGLGIQDVSTVPVAVVPIQGGAVIPGEGSSRTRGYHSSLGRRQLGQCQTTASDQ